MPGRRLANHPISDLMNSDENITAGSWESSTLHIDVDHVESVEIKGATLNEDLKDLVDEWRSRGVDPYGMNWEFAADELEKLIED